MKKIVYIFLLALTLFLIIVGHLSYNVKSKQDLQHYLKDGDIVQSVKLEHSKTTLHIVQFATNTGILLVEQHPFLDRWHVEALHENLEQPFTTIVSTKQGRYIVASGEQFKNQVMMTDGKLYDMKQLIQKQSIYISKDSIKKKYTDNQLPK